jgi:hypothetical protein
MWHPLLVTAEYGVQTWRVVANMLNKQLGTAGKGWFPVLGVGDTLTIDHKEHHTRKKVRLHNLHCPPDGNAYKIVVQKLVKGHRRAQRILLKWFFENRL